MVKRGVISLGEAFVDYISTDSTNTEYRKLLGGATVNLAVGTSRLGLPTYYLCKLGTDPVRDLFSNLNIQNLSMLIEQTEFSIITLK